MYDLYALGPPLYKIKAASLVAGIWDSITEKPVVLGLVSSPTQTSFFVPPSHTSVPSFLRAKNNKQQQRDKLGD